MRYTINISALLLLPGYSGKTWLICWRGVGVYKDGWESLSEEARKLLRRAADKLNDIEDAGLTADKLFNNLRFKLQRMV